MTDMTDMPGMTYLANMTNMTWIVHMAIWPTWQTWPTWSQLYYREKYHTGSSQLYCRYKYHTGSSLLHNRDKYHTGSSQLYYRVKLLERTLARIGLYRSLAGWLLAQWVTGLVPLRSVSKRSAAESALQRDSSVDWSATYVHGCGKSGCIRERWAKMGDRLN